MFEEQLCETYRKCAIFYKSGAVAESIIPCIKGKDIVYNLRFNRSGHTDMAFYTCNDISKENVKSHAKNVSDLYRVCIDSSGELPSIIPDFCNVCGKLFFTNNTRFNRIFHTCSVCRINECNKTMETTETITQYVYMIMAKEDNTVKIGTSNDPNKRLKQLQTGNNKQLVIVGLIKGGQELEKNIHALFRESRIKGEWFKYTQEIEDFFYTYKI